MRRLSALALVAVLALPALALASAAPPALSAPAVEIVRDQWGVAHVYADDAYGLFWGNGYAQAQDRLAQMEILRHVGQGRLAELVGPAGLALDLETRRELYTHEERVAALDALEPYWRDAFAAYADGVNAWIDEARADPTKLPVEYPALGVLPEPWSETDTIAIAQYLLDVFGRGSGGQELANAKLLDRLGGDWAAFDDLVWVQHPTTYTTIKAGDDPTPFAALPAEQAHPALPVAQQETVAAAVAAEPVDDARVVGEVAVPFRAPDPALAEVRRNVEAYALAVAANGLKFGSNAQLLDERFAANGKPMLYGGPQMGYFTPMIPYELGLHGAGACRIEDSAAPRRAELGCGFDAVGMGVAGAPGVIIGRNSHMAWTVTSGASDQVDTVAEKLVPGNPRAYYLDGVETPMDCRVETHLVRPGPADFAPDADPDWRPPAFQLVEQEVCRTVHGPVLWRTPDGAYAFASQRSYRGDEVRSGSYWLRIGTIDSLADFEALFEEFSFTFNFNFATEEGDIAYYHVGRQPLRDGRLDPRLPRPGWDGSYEWKGTLTLPDLPHVVNPASGYTVNWNNNPSRGWASGDAREHWGAIHRAEIMDEILTAELASKGKLTLDDLRAINERASTHEPYADDLFPAMRAAAAALAADGVANASAAVAALDAWAATGFDYADRDRDGRHDGPALRLHEEWTTAMMRRVFADDLGDRARTPRWDPGVNGADPHAADHGEHGHPFNVLVDALAGRTARLWCDDRATAAVETCADAARAAMAGVLAAGTWDDPLDARKSKFVALGAGPAYRIPMTNRPSFQHFHDFGLPEGAERSRNAVPPGVSGHMSAPDYLRFQAALRGAPWPLGATPPHLEDQLQMYVDFRDKPLLHARAAVEAHAESRTTFG